MDQEIKARDRQGKRFSETNFRAWKFSFSNIVWQTIAGNLFGDLRCQFPLLARNSLPSGGVIFVFTWLVTRYVCTVILQRMHFAQRFAAMTVVCVVFFCYFLKCARSLRQHVFVAIQFRLDMPIGQEIRACDRQGKPKSWPNLRACKCCFATFS